MKKTIILMFVGLQCVAIPGAMGAVAVKKAAPVATQNTGVGAGTASLVPTVLSLVAGAQELTKKQKELTAECVPSSAEINFVDNTMKEWAKTGAISVKEIQSKLKRKPCSAGNSYARTIQDTIGTDFDEICYDNYNGDGDKDMVWYQFPKVGTATYCSDGSTTCSAKNKRQVSDIYEIFSLIDFAEADYTVKEAQTAAKILSKVEGCSTAKLSAKTKAMWGEFLVGTISNVGQGTNTGAIMETVKGISAGGKGGGLGSLGAIATQFLDK